MFFVTNKQKTCKGAIHVVSFKLSYPRRGWSNKPVTVALAVTELAMTQNLKSCMSKLNDAQAKNRTTQKPQKGWYYEQK